jgi:D-galactose 1-dehydrogenase/L-arabinose 1- dehydrogenase
MHKSPIRLGLVGLGKIARDQHIPTIGANPRFELVATASPDGGVEGVPAFADIDAMLAADDVAGIDAVCLCTPPGVRADLARRAIAAGHHVMLEKPPAASLSQVAALSGAARASGRTVMATWHSRETAAADMARAWLGGQRVVAVRVVWREDVRQWHPGQDWLLAAGGFGVFDPAINAFSVLTHILPGALEVTAAELAIPANRAAAMEAQVEMLHDGTAPVTCDLSIMHPGAPLWDIAIETAAGTLHLGEGGRHLTIDGEPRPTGGPGEYPRVYDRFASLIDAGQSDVDDRPLMLVADALMLGHRRALPAFEF